MFGGHLKVPKLPPVHSKPPLEQTDIFMPCSANYVGRYAHRGRQPNTDYAVKLLHYNQRDQEFINARNDAYNKSMKKEYIQLKQKTIAEQTRRRREIENLLAKKLVQYEETVEKRREKLRVVLEAEEHKYMRETVDIMQHAQERKLQKLKHKCGVMKAMREKERREFSNKKRVQQYAERCHYLQPYMFQKHLEESKLVQIQQIRENEMRREGEREIDKMWLQVHKRQDEAILERERQEALIKYENTRKNKEILDMQIEAKKMLKEECKTIQKANRMEMNALQERIAKETFEAQVNKLKKRKKEANDIKSQIRMREEFDAKRKKEEHALDTAFARLAQLEADKLKSQAVDSSARLSHEEHIYRHHLKILQNKREEEEKLKVEMLDTFQNKWVADLNAKQCKAKAEKQRLLENVIKVRNEQLEYKRKEMELKQAQKQKENETLRKQIAANEALYKESERLAVMAAKTYQNDLKQQIEYNKHLRMKEKLDRKNDIQQSIDVEKNYTTIVKDIITGTSYMKQLAKHPFRKVVEQFDCHCKEK